MGPIIPTSVIIRHAARCCPFYASCPDLWINTVDIDPDQFPDAVQIGVDEFSSTALALLDSTGQPTNKTQLQDLDDQFIADFYAWRQTQFDISFVGSVVPTPNGLLDDIIWDFGSGNEVCRTRLTTAPHNFAYQQLGHQVDNPDASCNDSGGQIATKTPCVEVIGPPTDSSFTFEKWRICLEDGRLRQYDIGKAGPFGCGCSHLEVCVSICGMPIYGAIIQFFSGSILLSSCITGVNGCCTPDPAFDGGTATLIVTVSGEIVYSANRNWQSKGIIQVFLSTADVVCCGGYAIPKNLTLTDAAGSLSFTFFPNFFYPIWYGGHSVPRLSCTVQTPGGLCIANPATIGPVRICYQMTCYAGQNPTFDILRSWSWVYQQGTLTPIYYQDPSGFPVGLPCATAPPASCGSPLTDTADCVANPSSIDPFILSCNPVPAGSNNTNDPIGGSIVIMP